jgi:hypothetical protein
VSQGHLKSSSIGFVPTNFTKPGAKDWDHVANQLQSNWKEFDKARAEKSISRIITGGVLLEHSDVSVPCNADAEMISVCKSMHIEGTVAKQLGWEMKDGILVTKAADEPVPCVCDECGYVADAVPGGKCPECKSGTMKAKGKEKTIEIHEPTNKGMGNLSADDLRSALNLLVFPRAGGSDGKVTVAEGPYGYIMDLYEDHFIYSKGNDVFSQGYTVVGDKTQLVGDPEKVRRRTMYVTVTDNANKGFSSKVVEEKKAGVSCTCDECGVEAECAPGSTCQEPDCDGTMVADKKQKAVGIPCTCDECGAEADCAPGSACEKTDCTGKMRPMKKEEKSIVEIKVVRPAPSVKVLFVPPSSSEIAQRVGDAVEKALSRRTGKIL